MYIILIYYIHKKYIIFYILILKNKYENYLNLISFFEGTIHFRTMNFFFAK